jgi:hypothetical protein
MTLPTLKPLTNEDRARMALSRLHAAAQDLQGDDLLEYRMALSELRDWHSDYGAGAQLALAVFQLELSVDAAH